MKQPEQVEFAARFHAPEHVFAREIVDLDDNVGAQIAKFFRQMAEYLAGQHFQIGQRRRLYRPPGQRIGI